MYIVEDGNRAVAAHEDLDIIKTFLSEHGDRSKNYVIRKIKRKDFNKLDDSDDLYLTRFNHSYIPYGLYSELSISVDEYTYDFKYAIDIMMRTLEDDHLSKSDSKAMIKAIVILMKEIDSVENVDECTLSKMKELRTEYKNSF